MYRTMFCRTILNANYFGCDFTQERVAGYRVHFSSLLHNRRSEVSHVDQRPHGMRVLFIVLCVHWLRRELHVHCATRLRTVSSDWVKRYKYQAGSNDFSLKCETITNVNCSIDIVSRTRF